MVVCYDLGSLFKILVARHEKSIMLVELSELNAKQLRIITSVLRLGTRPKRS